MGRDNRVVAPPADLLPTVLTAGRPGLKEYSLPLVVTGPETSWGGHVSNNRGQSWNRTRSLASGRRPQASLEGAVEEAVKGLRYLLVGLRDLPDLVDRRAGDPTGSQQPRLLGRILVPPGAEGEPRGLHCSPDGLLFLTAGSAPFIHVLDLEGRSICLLPCRTRGSGAFVPEDVVATASGLVVASDLVHGAVRVLQHTGRDPQGLWVTVGTFLSPRGLAVDALGRFLVTDYVCGSVHSFTLGPTGVPLAPAAVQGLEGPCWVSPGPDGGLAVSEEFGDVWLFGSAHQPLGSLRARTGHIFGRPAGVCSDSEGNVIVADQQRRQVTLFPRVGPPICLLSEGLKRPLGVACAPQGQLVVADVGDNCIKVYQCPAPGAEP
ncbi:NHL-repeat-containing protein 4 [Thomomys bottae]